MIQDIFHMNLPPIYQQKTYATDSRHAYLPAQHMVLSRGGSHWPPTLASGEYIIARARNHHVETRNFYRCAVIEMVSKLLQSFASSGDIRIRASYGVNLL